MVRSSREPANNFFQMQEETSAKCTWPQYCKFNNINFGNGPYAKQMSHSPSKPRVLVLPTSRSRAASPLKPSAPSVARTRTKSSPQTPSKSLRRPPPQDEPPVPKTPVNIREAIALKQAEAKKAERASSSSRNGQPFDDLAGLEDALPT